jgi:hypothetical protein
MAPSIISGLLSNGRVAPFTVTLAGLIAAAHREGAPAVSSYLDKVEDAGFSIARAPLVRDDLRVEARLRTFAGVPFQ